MHVAPHYLLVHEVSAGGRTGSALRGMEAPRMWIPADSLVNWGQRNPVSRFRSLDSAETIRPKRA
jgi:hypothetical protein